MRRRKLTREEQRKIYGQAAVIYRYFSDADLVEARRQLNKLIGASYMSTRNAIFLELIADHQIILEAFGEKRLDDGLRLTRVLKARILDAVRLGYIRSLEYHKAVDWLNSEFSHYTNKLRGNTKWQ